MKGPHFFQSIHSYYTFNTWKKAWLFFFFPACTSHHVGSYFPDQGLNQNLLQWRRKVLNWTAREAPEEGMALAESNCQQKGQVAGARKDFEIRTH